MCLWLTQFSKSVRVSSFLSPKTVKTRIYCVSRCQGSRQGDFVTTGNTAWWMGALIERFFGDFLRIQQDCFLWVAITEGMSRHSSADQLGNAEGMLILQSLIKRFFIPIPTRPGCILQHPCSKYWEQITMANLIAIDCR